MSASTGRVLVSREAVEAARDAHRYNKVSDPSGKGLKLSSHTKTWKDHPDYVFVPSLRLVGSPAEVRQYLSQYYKPQDVEAAMADAYSKAAVESNPALRARFEAEVEAARKHKEAHPKSEKQGLSDLTVLDRIYEAQKASRAKSGEGKKKKKAAGSPGSPRGGGHKADLKAAYEAARKEGHGLNVNRIKATGAGSIKLKQAPGPKSHLRSLAAVPGLYAEKPEQYRLALQLIGKSPEEVERLTAEFSGHKGPKPITIGVAPVQLQAAPMVATSIKAPSPMSVPVPVPVTRMSPPRAAQQVPVPVRMSPPRVQQPSVVPVPSGARVSPPRGPVTITSSSPRRVSVPMPTVVQTGAPSSFTL